MRKKKITLFSGLQPSTSNRAPEGDIDVTPYIRYWTDYTLMLFEQYLGCHKCRLLLTYWPPHAISVCPSVVIRKVKSKKTPPQIKLIPIILIYYMSLNIMYKSQR